ncbi:MAG: hypothetical protein HY648_09930 [Acidobacteria bacterium]|nr:hypothetical protein [Acidobacteriota bacterium]
MSAASAPSSPSKKPHPFVRRLLSPWGAAAVLVVVLLLVQAYLVRQDRVLISALDNFPPFAAPEFALRFSRKTPYDPLSFVGRGARGGLWQWSPEGLILTEKGRQFFTEAGQDFVCQTTAGRRRVTRIRSDASRDGERQLEFSYEWVELSAPAAALLYPQLRLEEDYLGRATLTEEQGNWRVQSFQTPDFDNPLAHLQEVASGVLK